MKIGFKGRSVETVQATAGSYPEMTRPVLRYGVYRIIGQLVLHGLQTRTLGISTYAREEQTEPRYESFHGFVDGFQLQK
jgi:hypothetical protein